MVKKKKPNLSLILDGSRSVVKAEVLENEIAKDLSCLMEVMGYKIREMLKLKRLIKERKTHYKKKRKSDF